MKPAVVIAGVLLGMGGVMSPVQASQEVAGLPSIEVLVDQPPDNFALRVGEQVYFGLGPHKADSAFLLAGLDPLSLVVSVLVSAAVNASGQSNVDRFLAKDAPMLRKSIEQIDIRATVEAQLSRAANSQSPKLVVSTDAPFGRRSYRAQPRWSMVREFDHLEQRAKTSVHGGALAERHAASRHGWPWQIHQLAARIRDEKVEDDVQPVRLEFARPGGSVRLHRGSTAE